MRKLYLLFWTVLIALSGYCQENIVDKSKNNYYQDIKNSFLNTSLKSASAADNALVYVDYSFETDGLVDALTAKGYAVTLAASWNDFNTQLSGGIFSIAFAFQQGSPGPTFDLPIVQNYIASGGNMVFATFDMTRTNEAKLFEATFTGNQNLNSVTISDMDLAIGVTNPFMLTSLGWGTYSVGLSAIGSGEVLANFEDGSAAIVKGNSGQTIMLGYLSDTPPAPERQKIIENIITEITTPTEVCDGIDNDGDGDVDEGFDADSDGVADCFDVEECDGLDNDGNGEIDEGFDSDGDGTADCYDTEECDGLDNDGDGDVDEGFDADSDGVADCYDTEECDGLDNDGDGDIDEGFDTDSDGVADCFDTEECDGLDNDGNGDIDEGFDSDNDGTADCFDTEEYDGIDNDGDGLIDCDDPDYNDDISPNVIANNVTIYLDASGSASLTTAQIDAGSTDNCSIGSMSLDISSFNCSNVGENTVRLTVVDVNGNSSSETATVTVEDNIPPIISGPNDIIVNNDENSCGAIISYETPTFSDNCQNVTFRLIEGYTSGSTFPVGTTTVKYKASNIGAEFEDLTGSTKMDFAYNQDLDLFYSTNGGSSSMPMQTYSSDGQILNTINNSNHDWRGLWWNPNTKQLEGNGYGSSGIKHQILDGNGYVTESGGVIKTTNQPDDQSQGDYNYDDNEIIYYFGGKIYRIDYSSNTSLPTIDISGLPVPLSNLNNNLIGYCGIPRSEITLYDYVNKQIVFINKEDGSFSKAVKLPEDAPTTRSAWNVGFANNHIFIFNNQKWHSYNFNVSNTSAQFEFSITVNDNTAPLVKTKNISVELDENGQAIIHPEDIDNSSSDNCQIGSRDIDINSFNCSNLGTPSTVTLTVTDINDNSAQGTAMVTVEDNLAPIIPSLPDVKAECSTTVIAPTTTDNCAGTITGTTTNPLTYNTQGTHVIAWTFDDGNGNSIVVNQNVIIDDITDPNAICNDLTVTLDNSGTASISSDQIDNGSNDNCEISSKVLSKTNFDCDDLSSPDNMALRFDGINDFVNVDKAVIPTSGDFTVLVWNKSTPAQTYYREIISQIGSNGSFYIGKNADGTIRVTDDWNEIPLPFPQDGKWHNFAVVKTSTNTLLYIDGELKAEKGSTIDNPTGSNFRIARQYAHHAEYMNGDIDEISVWNTAKDITEINQLLTNSPKGTESDLVAYYNMESPSGSTILPDLTGNGNDGTLVNMDVNNAWVNSPIEGYIQPFGVTLTVTDIAGNSSSCTSKITVVDDISPVAKCRQETLEVMLDDMGMASISVTDIDAGSSDNCTLQNIAIDIADFTCSDIGNNTVTLTALDKSGNTSTCSSVVVVIDNISPIVSTKNITVQLENNGQASISASDIDNNSTDNCAIASREVDISSFDCSNIGTPVTVTLTATDASGNSAQKTAVVTVEDNIKPVVSTQNITVQLDANGQATITANDIDDSSIDNCGIASMNLDITSFDCNNVSNPVTVTLTVTDVNGNSANNTAIVTVEDNIKPIVNTKAITVQLDAHGQATITADDIDNNSTDNCSIASLEVDINTFDCSNIGTPVTVTLTATDVNGNSADNSAIVTVKDNVKPVVNTKDITLQLDENGAATVTGNDVNDNSTDNCAIASLDLDITSFDCSNIGTPVTVTLTVNDIYGNSAKNTAIVTVEDNIKPIVHTKNITIQLDDSGQATITASDIDDNSTDNCGIASYSIDKDTFNPSDKGVNIVTLTVIDQSGNGSSLIATVTVKDEVPPTVVCNTMDVRLRNNGVYSLTNEEVRALALGTTDNAYDFDELDIEISRKNFNCSDVGRDIKPKITVTDPEGNSSFCWADITVTPSESYTIPEVSDIEINLEAGVCEAQIQYPEFSGNACATFIQIEGNGPDQKFSLGATTEKWLVINANSDTTEVVFDVIVTVENALPTINNIDDVVVDEDANASINLSGITYGNDCLEQTIEIEASGTNQELINSASATYNPVDSSAVLSIDLVSNTSGSDVITVTVTDSEGGQIATTFNIEAKAVNDAPYVVTPVEDQTVNAAKTLKIPVSSVMGELFDDTDDPELDITISLIDQDTIPSWAVFENDTLLTTPMLGDMGIYSFVVTAADSSFATATDTFMVEVLGYPTGIEDIDANSFNIQVFPNPTKGLVKVNLEETTLKTTDIRVLNIGGKEVLRKEFNPGEIIELDLSDKVSGIYLISVTNGNNTAIKKVILDRK